MTTTIEKLRNFEGDLVAENKRLRTALKPFADAVYNDNGNMTITPCSISDYAKAYFVMRDLEKQSDH